MAITPTNVLAFSDSGAFSAGTYTLVSGTANESIRLLQYNVQNSGPGTIILQDSDGVIFATILAGGGINFNGMYVLSSGASLEAIVDNSITANFYFVGFSQ